MVLTRRERELRGLEWICKLRKGLALLLKAMLSVALVALVVRHLDFQMLFRQLMSIHLGWLALGAALFVVQTLVGAMRWQAIIVAQGGRIDLLTTYHIYYVSVFFATFTPGAVFGDVVRVWHAHRIGLSFASAISSVVLDRLIVVGYLVAIALVTVHFLPSEVQARFPSTAATALLVIAGVAGFGMLFAVKHLPERMKAKPAVGKLVAFCDSILSVVTRPRSLIRIIVLTAISQLVLCLAIAVLGLSVHMGLGVVQFMILMPPVILATILPISIGGWGMRETAMVFTLGLVGVAPEQAFLLAVLMGVVTIVMSLPGGLLWLMFPQTGMPRRTAPQP